MNQFLHFIDNNTSILMLISFGINLILALFFAINTLATSKLRDTYKKLVKGTTGKNIEGILMQHMDEVESIKKEFDFTNKRIDLLTNRISFCLQKVGFIRYSAFQDTGSDLSFSIALLDDNNDGVILTGIHGRAESMAYAKPVKEGKSNYSLSVEELQALERAKEKELDGIDIKGIRRRKEIV